MAIKTITTLEGNSSGQIITFSQPILRKEDLILPATIGKYCDTVKIVVLRETPKYPRRYIIDARAVRHPDMLVAREIPFVASTEQDRIKGGGMNIFPKLKKVILVGFSTNFGGLDPFIALKDIEPKLRHHLPEGMEFSAMNFDDYLLIEDDLIEQHRRN